MLEIEPMVKGGEAIIPEGLHVIEDVSTQTSYQNAALSKTLGTWSA